MVTLTRSRLAALSPHATPTLTLSTHRSTDFYSLPSRPDAIIHTLTLFTRHLPDSLVPLSSLTHSLTIRIAPVSASCFHAPPQNF